MKCKECGSEYVFTQKKGTRIIEIIKHYPDCPMLLRIKKKGLEV